MDDGFQNPGLFKDLSLVVTDGAVGFGNGRLIPAGPLRERIADGLARADALVIVGEDRAGVATLAQGRLVLHARLQPTGDAADLDGRRVLAFAGIGRPEKFFATLEQLGAQLIERVAFADHHPYRDADVARLLDRAAALDALPITTAKDAVRLPAALRGHVRVLPVAIIWQDANGLELLLDRLPGRLPGHLPGHPPGKEAPHGEAA